MAPRFDFKSIPECGAWARSVGRPCLQAAMANGKCYYHGGSSPIKHGRYTKQYIQKRREERQSIKELRESQKAMEDMVCDG